MIDKYNKYILFGLLNGNSLKNLLRCITRMVRIKRLSKLGGPVFWTHGNSGKFNSYK